MTDKLSDMSNEELIQDFHNTWTSGDYILREKYRAELLSRLTAGEEAIKKIEIYKEYITFLNEATKGVYGLALCHGWSCPQEDIDKGAEFRKKLGIGEFTATNGRVME